jgi:hypothetical protein
LPRIKAPSRSSISLMASAGLHADRARRRTHINASPP